MRNACDGAGLERTLIESAIGDDDPLTAVIDDRRVPISEPPACAPAARPRPRMRCVVASASIVLLAVAPAVRAVDDDSLRLARSGGAVVLTWTDSTPTVACVVRDVVAPPLAFLAEAPGLSFSDPSPAGSLLFYDVTEPASGTCGVVPPGCAAAGTLSCGTLLASSTAAVGSRDEVDSWAGCPGGPADGREVAFSFVALQAGTHRVLLTSDAALDVRLLRDDGTGCDPSACVASGDQDVTFAATPGSAYVVVIDGPAGVPPDFTVVVECPAAGTCAPVAALTCGGTDARNSGAPGSSDVLDAYASCFAAGLSGSETIYSFTAAADDTHEVRLLQGASALDVLVLRDLGAGCAAAECVAQGDVSADFAAAAGETYFIVVDGSGPPADFTIGMSCLGAQCVPDQSLICGQAIAHSNAWPVFTDVNDSYPCSALDHSGPEYTFRFTAIADGDAVATLSNLTAELDVLVTEEAAGCSPRTCVAFGDTEAAFAIRAGTTYDVIVDGRNGEEGFFRLDLRCAVPPSPCAPDAVIRCGDLAGNDTAAGRDVVDDWTGCASPDASGPESVFQFVPEESATVRVVMDLNVEDLDLRILHDRGAGCAPASCIAFGDREVTFDAVAGETYFVVVDGRAGASDTFRLWMECLRVPGACRAVSAIACGETVSASNDQPGSTDAIDTYDCRTYPEHGPEVAWAFTAAADGTARATLSNLGADLDVFVLQEDGRGCSQEACVAYGNVSADFAVTAGTTYYVVVEGFNGATGPFDLTVECL